MPLEISPAEYNNFYKSLAFVLKWEGGYVNDPDDPGGETKWGISKRSYPKLDIKNLTADEAAEIYYRDYWSLCNCNAFPLPLCTCLFDTAVNIGPTRAVGILKACGGFSETYIQLRKDYYTNLAKKNPTMQKYMVGWLNRCNDLLKFCELNTPEQLEQYPDQVSRSVRNKPTQSQP